VSFRMRTSVACTIGIGAAKGGRANNEDAWLIASPRQSRWATCGEQQVGPRGLNGTMLGVFDGMGRAGDGHIASRWVTEYFAQLYADTRAPIGPRRLLREVQDGHRLLHARAKDQGPVTMGTTAVVCWLQKGRAVWANVGDSRLYLFRDKRLRRITRDQTVNEFRRRDNREHARDGTHLCQCMVYGSRGLGNDPGLRLEPHIDCGQFELAPNDVLLLCSDGMCGFVADKAIEAWLQKDDGSNTANGAIELALGESSNDNITAVVAHVLEADEGSYARWIDESVDTVRF
jgi:serine/threonine protein phosphatase PrpC